MIDEPLDSDFALGLLNQAKDRIENLPGVVWEFLKVLDESLTWSTSDSYTTAKALPTRYARTIALVPNNYLRPLHKIKFEERETYKNISGYFYVDRANGNYYLTGITGESRTLRHWYIRYTPDLTTSTEPVWPGPESWQRVIAIEAAENYLGGIDSDDIAVRLSAKDQQMKNGILDAMRAWNVQNQLDDMNDSVRGHDVYPEVAEGIIDTRD